ncbi:MAG: phosphatase PAP2 family protein [Treponema sp.]|nr:phosphatase PAP2 family protein [Treponema sp.]
MKKFVLPVCLTVAFIVFTVLVCCIDAQPVAPDGSLVGFATINQAVHKFFGISNTWYRVTQILGLVAIVVAFAFAVVGFVQLLQRRSFVQVDRSLIVLGCVYVAVIVLYILFEKLALNVRPVLTSEGLEPSYPSTHTLLILTIFGTARYQLKQYVSNKSWQIVIDVLCLLVMVTAVAGRLVCGVHWCTDIVGGVILSLALIRFYKAFA